MDDFYFQLAQKIPLKLREGKEEDTKFVRLFCTSHYEPLRDIYGNLWLNMLNIWIDSLNSHSAFEFYRDYQREIIKAVRDSGHWCGFCLEWGSMIDRHFLFQVPISSSLLGINSSKSMP
jgi:hypothetical protein